MCDSQAETYVGIGVVAVIDIIDYDGLALRPCGVVVLVSLCRKTQYSTVLFLYPVGEKSGQLAGPSCL